MYSIWWKLGSSFFLFFKLYLTFFAQDDYCLSKNEIDFRVYFYLSENSIGIEFILTFIFAQAKGLLFKLKEKLNLLSFNCLIIL